MNQATVRIGDQFVGDGHPVFIVAEIGINHNGSLDLALASSTARCSRARTR